MSAFLLTIAIFLYLLVVGIAMFAIFSSRKRIVQSVMLAPALGLSVTLCFVYFLNRNGLPISEFGGGLTATLFGASLFIIIFKRPKIQFSNLAKYAIILALSLLLSAWPMFLYGFNWTSYANDDMANYALGAFRFYQKGFFDAPILTDIYQGKSYFDAYWFLYVKAQGRPGSELLLATAWATTGVNALEVFMPVIMALNLALISCVGAMVYGASRRIGAAWVAMSFVGISPLSTLGALYQLIGQVGGLALLVAAVTLLFRTPPKQNCANCLKSNFSTTLIVAALVLWYPEVLPFLGIGWLLYAALVTLKNKALFRRLIIPPLVITGLLVVFLNTALLQALEFLLFQYSSTTIILDVSEIAFPYMLIPSGISLLWGLVSLGMNITEPFLSITIFIGILASFWLLVLTYRQIKADFSAPAIMVFLMIALGVRLFWSNIDFGTFKLAMFIQPFMLAVVAAELSKTNYFNYLKSVRFFIGSVVLIYLTNQMLYVEKSTGELLGSMNQIPKSSNGAIYEQLRELTSKLPREADITLISDASHLVIAKFQAFYFAGLKTIFPSKQFFQNITGILPNNELKEINIDGKSNSFRKDFSLSPDLLSKQLLNSVNEKYSPINSYNITSNRIGYFSIIPAAQVRNHLIFVHSKLGIHYYFLPGIEQGKRRNTAFFPLEYDPMFPGQTFSGLGRTMLLMVVNPTERPRLVMEITATTMKNFGSELPKPVVHGRKAYSLDFVGRGSGRIFSGPIEPLAIDNLLYLSLDMGRDGQQFMNQPKGLMRLYGTDISPDSRYLTSFARDISLVSGESYSRLIPPAGIASFPDDLKNPALEYSGIYEDGWISERAFFVLKPNSRARYLVVKGEVPKLGDEGFRSSISVKLDKKEISRPTLVQGSYEVRIPIDVIEEKRYKIDLSFEGVQRLPGDDGRITGGQIKYIGFE